MRPETKSFVINAITVALVIAIVIGGYLVFVKSKETVSKTAVPSEAVDKTIMVGTEINKTFKDLGELKMAVQDARTMIGSPVFQTLKDFSVAISAEEVGRANPFIPASWKAGR